MKTLNPFINHRNRQSWQRMQNKQEALLIGFLVAGDPSPRESLQMIERAFAAGMDILELGIPSKDPKLDGEVIQRGHARVLETQKEMDWILDYCVQLRRRVKQPLWVMGYREELYQTGLYQVLAEKRLMDAILIPDCDVTEQQELDETLTPLGVDVARFVHHSLSDDEIKAICHDATLIYAQSYPGKTGQADADLAQLPELYRRIGACNTTAFRMVGFGICEPDKVQKAVAIGFQGVVVGSAFVAQVEQRAYLSLYQLIAEMKKETKKMEGKDE